ncbi:hypothetical protein IWW39_003822, partial [Coemansia spiralis]
MSFINKGKGKEPSMTPAASMTPGASATPGPAAAISDALTAEERVYQETIQQLQKTYAKKI